METTNPPQPNDAVGYSEKHLQHFFETVQELRNSQPAVRIDLANLANQLSTPRAKTFANEGIGRRLPVIERAALNIFRIYPPNRKEFLNEDECTDVAIQLHAFAINLYALFDNITWVCMLEAGQQLNPIKVGPFKPECQPYLPPALKVYLAQTSIRTWFDDYGKSYRDSTAHRIAPYLPSRAFNPEDAELWKILHDQSMQELLSINTESGRQQLARLERHEQLEVEKKSLGSNSLLVALSLTGEDAAAPVYLHPQLLCDWGLAHELILAFTHAMREQYGWEKPYVPPLVVN
jgi:hypothetical protein